MCNDWDKIKLEAVEELLRIKFAQPYLRYLLLATEEQELIEGITLEAVAFAKNAVIRE